MFGLSTPIAVMVANLTRKQVITIEYRRSPEFAFPIPIQDCIDATRYVLANRDPYSIGRFGLFGESAGGHG